MNRRIIPPAQVMGGDFTDTVRGIVFGTKIGTIRILETKDMLVSLTFTEGCPPGSDGCSSVLAEAREQVTAYLDGRLKRFDLPILLDGTAFQTSVWKTLCLIPYGAVSTYADIAERIGKPNAYRAVGNAVHRNPLPIIVPCHRIIRSDGDPGGYAWGTERKIFLLGMER